jgi:hypothetical protein
MGCGCGGGRTRRTQTTSDVQAAMDSGQTYYVRSSDGEELYQGTSYLAAMRAKNGNRDKGARLSTS